MAIVVDKTEDIKGKIAVSENKKKDIQKEIKKLQKTLEEYKKMSNEILKKIKDSTGVRETMARRASTAIAEVRQTRE